MRAVLEKDSPSAFMAAISTTRRSAGQPVRDGRLPQARWFGRRERRQDSLTVLALPPAETDDKPAIRDAATAA